MRQMAWASLQKHLVGWKTLSAFVGRREDARESGGVIPMREFGKGSGAGGRVCKQRCLYKRQEEERGVGDDRHKTRKTNTGLGPKSSLLPGPTTTSWFHVSEVWGFSECPRTAV